MKSLLFLVSLPEFGLAVAAVARKQLILILQRRLSPTSQLNLTDRLQMELDPAFLSTLRVSPLSQIPEWLAGI